MSEEISKNEILDFVEYVDSFYNPVTGVYPIGGATVEVITKAIKTYIQYLEAFDGAQTWGGGDSVDRERVRDIILAQNPKCVVMA